MARKMKISPKLLMEEFSSVNPEVGKNELSTSQVSDAVDNLLGKSGVIPDVKPIKDGFRIMGKVITAKTSSADWGTVLNAIELAKPGEILFLQSENDDKAIWGELTSINAQNKGIQGTIIYGAARDVTEVKYLDYPIFSRSIVPNAGTPLSEGEVNVPLHFDNLIVSPGDTVIADDGGVVVVPQENYKEVISAALKIKENEERILNLIKSGKSLKDIIGI
ncbi:MAG: dimethylmenaquinone methyltransferase [Methanobacteriales archaeon Met13]